MNVFRKNNYYWTKIKSTDKACMFRQTETKNPESECIGFVTCTRTHRPERVIGASVIPEGIYCDYSDRDFGYSAWQYQRDEEETATKKFETLNL